MDDLITNIAWEKGTANITVNEEETLRFSRDDFSERPLAVGESVDLTELREWLLPRQYQAALHKAVAFLAIRNHSALEVKQKLKARKYMESTIEMVLYKLEQEKILDDEAFARNWIRERMHRQYGKMRIAQELHEKGISRELAARAFEELAEEMGEDADTPIRALARTLLWRVRNEADERKAMDKVLAAMARRGFFHQEARSAVEAVRAEMAEDEEE